MKTIGKIVFALCLLVVIAIAIQSQNLRWVYTRRVSDMPAEERSPTRNQHTSKRSDEERSRTRKQDTSNKLKSSDVRTPTKAVLPSDAAKIRQKAVDWFTIKNETEKDDLLNRHKYVYNADSKLCSRNISVLIVIHSGVTNDQRRRRIRDTWASVATGKYKPVVVFMLGEDASNSSLQKYIEMESNLHGDIVQGNFIDSYLNLTYKHVMAIHWIASHCNEVRTVVKMDDDVFVDVYKLGNYSMKTGHKPNALNCHIFKMEKPKRSGKWAMSKEIYPFRLYPVCCEGMVYITSLDVIKRLTKASEDTRFLWIDDVYVTGLLALKAGVGHVELCFGHKPLKWGWVKNKKAIQQFDFKPYMFLVEFEDQRFLMPKLN